MRMAASSPVWLTRRAEERKSRCSWERGRIGFFSWEEALAETRGEAGEIGAWASDGGGGWWVVCVDVDVLWKREAHAVLGARKL
jgi:hypothetical protein